MENLKREIYEIDAIEEMQEQAYRHRMESQGKVQCKSCEEWEHEEDLTEGLCESCVNDIIAGTTLEDVMEYASTLDEDDELALYTDYLLSKRKTIWVLKSYYNEITMLDRTHFRQFFKKRIEDYIKQDTSHYIEYLDKKGSI